MRTRAGELLKMIEVNENFDKYKNLWTKVNTHIEDAPSDLKSKFDKFEDPMNGPDDSVDYEGEYNDLLALSKKLDTMENRNEEFVSPPELYAPVMEAYEKFRAALKKLQPMIHRDYYSKTQKLSQALDTVDDLLSELGDEVDESKKVTEDLIDDFEKIVKSSSMGKVAGIPVDLTTAGIVMQIYNKLNPANQAKFRSMSAQKMIDSSLFMMDLAKK